MDLFLLFREDLPEDLPADFYFPGLLESFLKFRAVCIRFFQLFLFCSSGLFRVLPLLPLLPFCWLRGSASGLLILSDFCRDCWKCRFHACNAPKSFTPRDHLRRENISHAGKLFTPSEHSETPRHYSGKFARRENYLVFRIQAKEKAANRPPM